MSSSNNVKGKYRNLLLSGDVEDSTVNKIIESILEINDSDAEKEEYYKDYEREPIILYINTGGGGVYSCLALIDVIKTSETPVVTVAIGRCMSAGLWIFLSGGLKLVGKNATLMFHDVANWISGKTEYIKQELKETERLSEMYKQMILDNSSILREKLDDIVARQAEWYIPADEAIKLGLADDYLD